MRTPGLIVLSLLLPAALLAQETPTERDAARDVVRKLDSLERSLNLPALVTKLTGPNPLRVVFDPGRRLDAHYRIFSDAETPTLYACSDAHVRDGESQFGAADILPQAHSEQSSSLTIALTCLGAAFIFAVTRIGG